MPSTQAITITLSQRQEALLKQIVRCTTNPYRLVRRAQLILAAADGLSNTQISNQLQLERGQVRLWRSRWASAEELLESAVATQVSDQKLMTLIITILSDEPRPGTPKFFSTEEVVQIVALACETPPDECERPVTHWTARELAEEAINRGIVQKISARTVGRFLKGGHSPTPSPSLLAQCQSRRPG